MKELKFVDVGEGITEGHVRKWLVKDGEQVNEDQSIVRVETDKAVVDVPSPIAGMVKISAPENTNVRVGDTIAYIGEPDELRNIATGVQAAVEMIEPGKEKPSMATAPAKTATRPEEIMATPAVRKLARDLNVDITKIIATGPNGRMTENDVRNAARQTQQTAHKAAVPKYSEVLEEQHGKEVERVPMSQTRKAIARNMELSWTIPRAVHMDKVNATRLYEIVQQEKQKIQDMGVKLTFLPFIMKALIGGLKEIPRFNSSYDHERSEIILKKYYNIGLAAEGPDGLKVVVVKNADRKSIVQIAMEIQELSEKVKNQTIALEEMRDSTFTITNIGSLGGGYLSVPMINYPEVGILGVHLIREEPIAEDGKIKIGRILPISISFDHRVVDGADAVLLGNAIRKYLEDPEFLEMLG